MDQNYILSIFGAGHKIKFGRNPLSGCENDNLQKGQDFPMQRSFYVLPGVKY
jgi:hypothetical protein